MKDGNKTIVTNQINSGQRNIFLYQEQRNLRSQTCTLCYVTTKTSERLIPSNLDEVSPVDSKLEKTSLSEGLVLELRADILLREVISLCKVFLEIGLTCNLSLPCEQEF